MRQGVEKGIVEPDDIFALYFLPRLFLHLPDLVGKHGIYQGYDKIHQQQDAVISCIYMQREPWRNKKEVPDQGA
jgi:hypothetical protein